jgi:hypothetical protein
MSWLCRKRTPLAWGMITCVVEYIIVPAKIDAFERFGRRWMELVDSHGGMHHGYFLPAEGASDKALALFSFPSLAAYEQYRVLFGPTRTLSKRTASGTRAAVYSVTSGPSCGPCCPGIVQQIKHPTCRFSNSAEVI